MHSYDSYSPTMTAESARAGFIRRTYAHVAGALLLFAILLSLFLSVDPIRNLGMKLVGNGRWGWMLVLGAFMAVSYIAEKMAHSFTSQKMQYAGLGLYVLAEAFIFTPIMAMAMHSGKGGVILQSVIITLGLVAGLTGVVMVTKKSFSGLRSVLVVGSFVALGIILAGAIFGFNLGLVFMGAMIILMAISVLYNTGRIMHEYPEWAYVGAALGLFASIATLFWYVVQFLLSFTSSD
jgi:FtsH-binding integral membrane protein